MKKVPFYSSSHQAFVVAEMCVCGHLHKDHGSKLIDQGGKKIRQSHEGNCCHGRCDCPGYRWSRYVLDDEYAEIVIGRRKTPLTTYRA